MVLTFLLIFLAATQGFPGIKKKVTPADNSAVPAVRGILKAPLGEIISIEGVITDGTRRGTKGDSGRLMMVVTSINGTKIQSPIIIAIEFFSWGNVKTPKIDENKKYVGYETGGYRGIPAKAFDYLPQATTESFHFETYFQVCGEGVSSENLPYR